MNRPLVLCIDDEANVLQSLKRVLRKEPFELEITQSAEQLYSRVQAVPVALVISDQRMPDIEGTEVLKKVKELSPDTMTIMLTGYADIHAAIKAINSGNIFRFLTKPWNDDELKGAIAQALKHYHLVKENERLLLLTQEQNRQLTSFNEELEKKVKERTLEIQNLNRRLEKSFLETVKVMGDLAGLDNVIVAGHSRRVAKLAGGIAKELGLDSKEIFQIEVASFLHDIGKTGLGPFEKQTPDMRKSHPDRAARIVALVPGLEQATAAIQHHHECFDGSGYPDGLKGETIPLGARIISVADTFDKILNLRAGFETQTASQAWAQLQEAVGKFFDPKVVSALGAYLEKHKQISEAEFETEINLYELRDGMILSRPLTTKKGRVMLGSDYRIDQDTLERIWKRHHEDPFSSEVFVYKKSIQPKHN